jgi:tRNA-2-methylthio-N6-dimethylallyladenosine synthase
MTTSSTKAETNAAPENISEKQPIVGSKKLFIKTYGCQMNIYDSEKMQDLMAAQGFSTSDDMEDSDLVIINTCHIREKASEKMYSELGRIRDIKAERKAAGKRTIIAVAGCVAQAEGAEIKARAPYVDVIVGPQSFQRLPQLVTNAEQGVKNGIDLDFSTDEKFDFLREESEAAAQKFFVAGSKPRSTAFLTIQEGCDKFCTFCVVPYTRGAEVSRPVEQIYREALKLAEEGVKEISLLGQNVNAYHGKANNNEVWGLGKLTQHIANIPQIERIRYSTSHPKDVDDELILAHAASNPKIMPFIHLPVQSGSDNILKAMNRKHTADDYLRTIEKFRKVRPDIEFSSDFIVGFPGETEQDFKDTMRLVEQVEFTLAYSFLYSPRQGTPAANLPEDNTPKEVKKARLIELQALIEKQMQQFLNNKIGTRQKVLVNRDGKMANQVQGFTESMQPVIINMPDAASAAALYNQVVEVEITRNLSRALEGKLLA